MATTYGIPAWSADNSNINQWQETGASLENAITAYFQSCLTLEGSFSTRTSLTGFDNLPTLLERRIENFHTILTQPLAQSLSSLARVRNKLKTSIYRIPPEILGRIFEFAIIGANANIVIPMDQAIQHTWRTLYRVLGVCSIWQKVALAHAPLWSLVPLVYRNGYPPFLTECSAQSSLERATGSRLYLAADLGEFEIDWNPSIWATLAKIGSRSHTINIHASSYRAVQSVFLPWIHDPPAPENITELSLCVASPSSNLHRLPHRMDSLFPYDPSSQAALEQILSSLRVLRLKAVHISVDNLMFRNLVELRIQEVMVGRDVDLVQFLSALAPASQLRTLEMISMTSYVDPGVTPAVRDFPIHFPSLETLFLAGLLSNVIHTVLGSIAPGEYRILFSASSNCLRRMEQTGGINAGINGLNIALHDHKVDTLILNNHWHPTNPSTTAALLSIMPTLTTIYFIDWVLDQGTLSALTRTTMDTHFPQFHKMHISQCVIHDIGDPTEFMAMIMSHRVQELTLGGWLGEVLDTTSDNTTVDVEITGPDMRTDPIRDWLYQNVPKLTLLEPEKDVGFKEFNTGVWQLW